MATVIGNGDHDSHGIQTATHHILSTIPVYDSCADWVSQMELKLSMANITPEAPGIRCAGASGAGIQHVRGNEASPALVGPVLLV